MAWAALPPFGEKKVKCHRELALNDPAQMGMVEVAGKFRGTGQEYQGIL